MNMLKGLFTALLLCIGMSYSANAQDILSPEEKEAVIENVTEFITELNLSEMDKPAFRQIVREFFIGLVALGGTNFSEKTNQKILRALIKERNSRMKDLLSKDQYKVYKARIKERRENLIDLMKEKE